MMLAGEKKKTKAINNELNPVWNEGREKYWLFDLWESCSPDT